MNNFQVQSPDFLYVNSSTGLMFDTNGLQIILHNDGENYQTVFATILQAVKPRGSPVFFYQESVEYDYQDAYLPLFNSGVEMHVVNGATDPAPYCPLNDVPWDLIIPGDYPFIVVCNGLAEVQSTYGDNRVYDYPNDQEGNMVKGNVVYTVNFTAVGGTTLWQVSIDVLNNTFLDAWVRASTGIYNGSDGSLITMAEDILFLQVLDQMVVVNLLSPIYIQTTGTYFIGMVLSGDYKMASSSLMTPSMSYEPTGQARLPNQFIADGMSPMLPVTAYGCVQATHYFCGSFQSHHHRHTPVTAHTPHDHHHPR